MKRSGRMLLLTTGRYQIRSEFLSVVMVVSSLLLLHLVRSLIRWIREMRTEGGSMLQMWHVLLLLLLVIIALIILLRRPFGWTLYRIAMNRSISRILGCVTGRNRRSSAGPGCLHLLLIGATVIRSHSRFRPVSRDFTIVKAFTALGGLDGGHGRHNFTSSLVNRLQLVRFRFGTIVTRTLSSCGVDRFPCDGRRQQRIVSYRSIHIRHVGHVTRMATAVNAFGSAAITGRRRRLLRRLSSGVNAFRANEVDITSGKVSALRRLQLSSTRSVNVGRLNGRSGWRFSVDGLRPIEIARAAGWAR